MNLLFLMRGKTFHLLDKKLKKEQKKKQKEDKRIKEIGAGVIEDFYLYHLYGQLHFVYDIKTLELYFIVRLFDACW